MWSDNLTGFILMLSLRDELHRSNFAVTYAGAYLTLSLVWKIFFSHIEQDVHKSNQVFT